MSNLSEIIAPGFFELHKDIKADLHTHYFIKGGRGSTKSSFVSIEMILGIMRSDDYACGIAFRKVGQDLKDSVFNQLLWAIDELGVSDYWKVQLSPLKLIYVPTGQHILFRGVDDPSKSKSIKLKKGYFKYVWFEEADQFAGMEEIRKILQSLLRGGTTQKVFYTYNPPQSIQSWINAEVLISRTDRFIHHSTYLDVPKAWLGDLFISEAEFLKVNNEDAYNHEYLGEVTGTGGEIFKNVILREITDEELQAYGQVYRGLDFGFTTDPTAYICCCLHNRRLYIFYEFYKYGLGFNDMANDIFAENTNNSLVYADSAEPRSIYELAVRGVSVTGARKGPDSVDHGIKRLSQDLIEIVIDDKRCPNAAKEFSMYEYDKDKQGNFKSFYPDHDNHTIDAVRYALSQTEFFRKEIKPQVKRHIDFDFQREAEQSGINPNDLLNF